jgi:hypothetical protein
MMSLSAQSRIDPQHLESGPRFWAADTSPDAAQFLQPTAGRIVTGTGLAGGQLRQALRHHSSVARRIALGRLILKIIGKGSQPL